MVNEFMRKHPYKSRYLYFVTIHLLTITVMFLSWYMGNMNSWQWRMVWTLVPIFLSMILVWKALKYISIGREYLLMLFWIASLFAGAIIPIYQSAELMKQPTVEVSSLQEAIEMKEGLFKPVCDIELDLDNAEYRIYHCYNPQGAKSVLDRTFHYDCDVYFPVKNVDDAMYVWNINDGKDYEEEAPSEMAEKRNDERFERFVKEKIRTFRQSDVPKYLRLKAYPNGSSRLCGCSELTDNAHSYASIHLFYGEESSNEYKAFIKMLVYMSIILVSHFILGLCIRHWIKEEME